MVYFQFEVMGIDRVKIKRFVVYIDYNIFQIGLENVDDYLYIQIVVKKYGIYFFKFGNGICYQVYLERFVVSGQIFLGLDSYILIVGGIGMFVIGVGGLDVVVVMGGGEYYLIMLKIVKVNFKGKF